MKIGDDIIMFFHCAGLVSEEEWEVTNIDENTIELGNEWNFDKKTGKCLNDNNMFGAKRTIKPLL